MIPMHVFKRNRSFRLFPLTLFAISIAGYFAATSCAQKKPQPFDSIGLAVPYEIETLDPHAKSKLSSFAVLSHFYESLVTPAADMSIRPSLADTWENPDLLTWNFHLRPSIQFHSGKMMTAEDVVYSLRRVLDHPEFETATYVSNVVDVREISKDSVQVRTRYPTAILLNKLSFIPIIPKGSTTEFLVRKEDGTGPYRLHYWDEKGNRIALTRNDKYWGRAPAIREAIFYLGQDDEEGVQKLLSGECQFFQGASRNSEARVKKDKRFRVERKDSLYVKYLGFNFQNETTNTCEIPPNSFSNRLLREALNDAIDRSKLIASLNSYGFPLTQAVPPFTFGFNPEIPAPKYDPQKAKMLLKETGFPNGFEVTLHVRKLLDQAASEVKDQLATIGIRVQLRILPDAQFFRELRSGKFCMFLSRFGSPTGDASDILESAFHSYDPPEHFGQLNYGRYSNPDLDALIVRSFQTQQLERRKQYLQEIMSLLMQEKIWIPLYGDQDVYIYDSSFSWTPRIDSLIKIWEIQRKS
jgi:peptide/nickel transport system substrate-binding protein